MLPVFSFSVQAFYYTLSKLGTSGHAGCVDVGGVGAMVKFLLRDLSLSASALLLFCRGEKTFQNAMWIIENTVDLIVGSHIFCLFCQRN